MKESFCVPRVLAAVFTAQTSLYLANGYDMAGVASGIATIFLLAAHNDQIGALPRELGPDYLEKRL